MYMLYNWIFSTPIFISIYMETAKIRTFNSAVNHPYCNTTAGLQLVYFCCTSKYTVRQQCTKCSMLKVYSKITWRFTKSSTWVNYHVNYECTFSLRKGKLISAGSVRNSEKLHVEFLLRNRFQGDTYNYRGTPRVLGAAYWRRSNAK